MARGGFAIRQRVKTPPLPIRTYVKKAIARGLPPVAFTRSGDRIVVVATGPSALDFDFSRAEIRHHEQPEDILAVNGALRLFTDRGYAPRFWAACDPQPGPVGKFLEGDLPHETTYLIASKCHPSIFERLQGRQVMIWHVRDKRTADIVDPLGAIPTAVSVTICAMDLMIRDGGYSQVETWGWDGCYLGGAHHAVAQDHGSEPILIGIGSKIIKGKKGKPDAAAGGKFFETTGVWAVEATDAIKTMLLAQGRWTIDVRGDGMIAEALRVSGQMA